MKNHLIISLIYLLSFHLAQSQTPVVNLQTDVLVIGGTASGISAGIQSARLGVNTLVVEETPWLGGMLTSAGVPAFDGNNAMPAGLFGEFRQHLYDYYGGANAVSTGWVSNTLFEPHIGDSIFKSMARKEQLLTVKYNYQFKSVIKNGHTIIGAEFYEINTGAQLIVKAKRVIDATELGDALASAKVPYDLGMESNAVTGEQVNLAGANDIIQDITYVGILKDYGSPQPLIPRPINYDSTEFDGSNTSFYKDTNRKRPSVDAKKMLEYGKLPNNKYMLNWPIYGNDIYLNVVEKTPKQREALLEQAKQQTLRFVYFIQKDLGFNHLALANDEFPTKDKLALYPYHRESRRMHGMVRMLVQHISKPFDTPQPLFTTGIAVGDYPVDHHHKKNSAAPQHLEFFPVPSFNIPLGALIPKDASNFIVAEKSISVSNIVNGTTRLQPCVMQIGQASGLLAALSIKNRVDPKNISVRQVQQALLDANGYIMPYKDVTQKDRYFKAIQKIGATGLLRGVGVPTGWANATYFNPNDKVKLDEFSIAWNKKFIAHSFKSDNDLTISDALFVAAKLSITSVEKIKNSFELKWKSIGLQNFNMQRSILRYELAAILDQYNVFNIFDVDIYGNYTKL
ncbi:MAG TPA: FAD-dependent oxidoreductase [Chitinophagaceae bacterium]|nr:FAD-dependent oxidoreductase [Chitinophagaceae bacterium]